MINLKVLSTAAAMALLLPMVSAVQAQDRGAPGMTGGGGARAGGGGGGAAMGGGGFRAGAVNAPSMGGAPAGMRPGPAMGSRPMQGGGDSNRFAGRGGYGGGYNGGGYRNHYRGGGGFWPGVAVGVGVGSTYGYYGSPSYYDDSYGYYDDSAVAAAPPSDDDAVAYCTQRYRSYDPASGTYLGNDGLRHPCPAQ